MNEHPSRDAAIFLATQAVAELGCQMLLDDSPRLRAQMRLRARQLVLLLEGQLLDGGELPGEVIDLVRQQRRRAILAALGALPESPPPRAA